MSDFCTADNPYNPKARDARDAERGRRNEERRQYQSRVNASREDARFIARACGMRVIDAPRRESEYVLPVPEPPIHPYHEQENQYGTTMIFEDAVKNYDDWQSGRRKRQRN